ncbi:MAG: cation diffusion facilitator family transporter [Dehalococcoidia bacterium]|nr:cation diffusion facilitator family transporter [Dehalococcoidia bacterium]
MSEPQHSHASTPRALTLGLALTMSFVVVEVVTGMVTGSLALVADAGHMVTDSAGLLLALAAATLARRPANDRRTYGYARLEVLVVPVHVVLLLAIAGYIIYESIGRLGDGHAVDTGPVIVTGVVGLMINLLVVRVLHGHAQANLNARAALFEAFADALGSVGVIVSAVAMTLGAWRGIDAIVALAIAAFIVPRAVHLLRQSADILLESAPAGLDPATLASAAREVRGVIGLHDVHVWSIAPSFPSLSAHVELEDVTCTEHVLTDLATLFRDRFGVGHVTLQPETQALHEALECCLSPDAARLADDHSHVAART